MRESCTSEDDGTRVYDLPPTRVCASRLPSCATSVPAGRPEAAAAGGRLLAMKRRTRSLLRALRAFKRQSARGWKRSNGGGSRDKGLWVLAMKRRTF